MSEVVLVQDLKSGDTIRLPSGQELTLKKDPAIRGSKVHISAKDQAGDPASRRFNKGQSVLKV